ncbi:HAD hydrolase-like protein [Phenylobacterium sp.]|uniref:HAD hydrolase-like protein n=1 Tax=Phenylobacterium sp. TaxID=1871053 RepID=UPI0030F3E1CE
MAGRPTAILFDLDGTLVDSEPGIRASAEAALAALGHEPIDFSIAELIGPPLEEVMTAFLKRFGDDRVAEAVLAYREHYGAEGYRATEFYPGVSAMLAQFAGLPLYVATSKRTVFARRILEHLEQAAAFEGIYGSEPDGALDNKAALIADVLKRHDLAAHRCLMVGDRRQDVLGAQANGVPTVGVLWGYGDRDELETAGARWIISRPSELVDIASDPSGGGLHRPMV